MLTSMSWLEIQNRIQHVSTVISCAFNSILIFLIVKYSPKKIGNYKWLMIYISVFQILYSIMDVISLPVYHTVGSVFLVFKDVKHNYFHVDKTIHFYLLVAYTGCYGFCMAIFGIHFYYRYLAITGKKAMKVFQKNRMFFWFLIPPFFGLVWAVTVRFTFYPTEDTNGEISSSLMESYELEIQDIVYIAAFIWPTDSVTGKKYLNLRPTIGIGIEEVIVMSSLSAIFYFGTVCYMKIREHVTSTSTVSQITKNLQRQLFYALVMQTTIPIMLLHVPVSGLFMFPIIDSELGFLTGFVTITIAIYPAIDPLPNMFVIENYRNAIFSFFAFIFYRNTRTTLTCNTGGNPTSIVN